MNAIKKLISKLRYVTLIRSGQTFNNSYWLSDYPSDNEPLLVDNFDVAPDKTLTACKFYDAGTVLSRCLIYESSVNILAGDYYSFSIYVKPISSPCYFQISSRASAFSTETYANFNINTGECTDSGSDVYNAKIYTDADGWYRVAICAEAISDSQNGGFVIALIDGEVAANQSFSISDETCLIWGAKLELGQQVTPYRNTSTFNKYTGVGYMDMTEFDSSGSAAPNLLEQTENFDNSYWTKSGSGFNVLVTPDTTTAPNATTTADTLKEGVTSTIPLFLESSVAITNTASYVFSIYAKANTATAIQILGRSGTFGVNRYANFNLSTGVVGSKGSGCTSGIIDAGSGWYRCYMVCTATANGTGGYSIGLINNNPSAARGLSYMGTSKELYIWGAKLELGTSITDYEAPATTLLSFGFATDLHYGLIDNYAGRYPQDGLDKLTDAVTFWNTQSLDFAFMNGDYIDSGHIAFTSFERTESETLVDLSIIEAVYDDFIGDRYYSLGNHDMDKISKTQFISNTGMASKYYSFDVAGIRFIVLDATYLSDDDNDDFDSGNHDPDDHLKDWVPPTQRTWLDTQLSTASGDVIVFCHQSLHSNINDLSVNNSSVVRGILETYSNVIAVFTGHEHNNLLTIIKDIPYYSMEAMTKGSYPLNAYAIINVYDNHTVSIVGYGNQSSY